jgi:hypothetical protein
MTDESFAFDEHQRRPARTDFPGTSVCVAAILPDIEER